MLPKLFLREIGFNSPSILSNWKTRSRIESLSLSQHFDFQQTHTAGINSCDLDPGEERYLLSGSGNGSIAIHDLRFSSCFPQHKFKVVSKVDNHHKEKHKNAVSKVEWYPHDTGAFTSSSMDHSVKIWDTNDLCVVSEFSFANHVYCHKLSQPLLLIAVGCGSDKIQLIDLKSNSSTHKLTGHRKKNIMDLCWSPRNDFHLASAGKDGRVILWDVRKARSCCLMFDRHNTQSSSSSESVNTAHDGIVNSLCYLPDGNHLLSFGTDDCVRLWNADSGKNMLCNYGKVVNKSKLKITMSCDGSLAFVPCAGNIIVLDIFTGHRVTTLRGHLDQVNCCIYKRDLQEVISGSKDRNILHWSSERDSKINTEGLMETGFTADASRSARGSTQIVRTSDDLADPLRHDNWSDDDD